MGVIIALCSLALGGDDLGVLSAILKLNFRQLVVTQVESNSIGQLVKSRFRLLQNSGLKFGRCRVVGICLLRLYCKRESLTERGLIKLRSLRNSDHLGLGVARALDQQTRARDD